MGMHVCYVTYVCMIWDLSERRGIKVSLVIENEVLERGDEKIERGIDE